MRYRKEPDLTEVANKRDFFRIEKPGDDFPYYNGKPTQISPVGWVILLGFQVLGFFALRLNRLLTGILPDPIPGFIAAIAMLACCVLGLVLATRKNWTAIFRRFHARNLGSILWYIFLAFVFGIGAAKLVGLVSPTVANPGILTSEAGLPAFFTARIEDIFQLMGEEFIALVPFLALLTLCYQVFKWSRKTSIIVALLVSSVIFGLLHLSTYNWNWLQCIFAIGMARIPFTLAYIRTKNFFVAFLTHYLFDAIIFTFAFFVSSFANILT